MYIGRETLTLLQSHVATTLGDAMAGQVIDALAAALRELESSVEEPRGRVVVR